MQSARDTPCCVCSRPRIDEFPPRSQDINWNFSKFLLDKFGRPVRRYDQVRLFSSSLGLRASCEVPTLGLLACCEDPRCVLCWAQARLFDQHTVDATDACHNFTTSQSMEYYELEADIYKELVKPYPGDGDHEGL